MLGGKFAPGVTTIFLVAFSLFLGAIIMNFGGIDLEESPREQVSTICIEEDQIDNELKELQIDYILNKISLNEYLEEEKELRE